MKIRSILLMLVVTGMALSILYACGGSGVPTAKVTPEDGSDISTSEILTILFSDSMDPDSIVLGGTMAGDSDGGVWSKTNKDNDTLTLSPDSFWNSGERGTLTIAGTSSGGKDLETVDLSYHVLIVFSTFQRAEFVIGQSNFVNTTSNGGEAGPDASGFEGPYGNPTIIDGLFYAPDYGNARTLIFDPVPTSSNPNADHAIGQTNLISEVAGDGGNDELDGPQTAQGYNGKFYQLDYTDNRILIFNTPPNSNAPSADKVIGQSAFDMEGGSCTSSTFDGPESFFIADGKLFVSDSGNNRVLIWNTVPTTNGASADVVLGQSNFTNNTENDDDQDDAIDPAGPTSRTLSYPAGIWSDGTKLVVNDSENHRVLIWNSIPTENFERADVVLGQSDFTHKKENDDNQNDVADATPSNRTLNNPYNGVFSNGTQLLIGDENNHRILIWNTFPTENFERADVVLGQSDFKHFTANDDNQNDVDDGNATSRTFNAPNAFLLFGNQLFVTDKDNNRYLVFDGQ